MNEHLREFLARWPPVGLAAIVLIAFSIGGVAFGYANASSEPPARTEQVAVLDYSLTGNLGYAAYLKDNQLYGPVQLTDQDTSVLHLSILDNLEGSFTCQLQSDRDIRGLSHQVQVTATLENPRNWSKTVVLVPETYADENFSVSFPIDLDYLLTLAQDIDEELQSGASIHELTIKAVVETTADSQYGPIETNLTSAISGQLSRTRLTWDNDYDQSATVDGSLYESRTVEGEAGSNALWWAISLGALALIGTWVSWVYLGSRRTRLSVVKRDAGFAGGKYKEAVVNVEELPDLRSGNGSRAGRNPGDYIRVASLDELVKISATLFKPVLRKTHPDRHVYRVVDGRTTYEYVSTDDTVDDKDDTETRKASKRR